MCPRGEESNDTSLRTRSLEEWYLECNHICTCMSPVVQNSRRLATAYNIWSYRLLLTDSAIETNGCHENKLAGDGSGRLPMLGCEAASSPSRKGCDMLPSSLLTSVSETEQHSSSRVAIYCTSSLDQPRNLTALKPSFGIPQVTMELHLGFGLILIFGPVFRSNSLRK